MSLTDLAIRFVALAAVVLHLIAYLLPEEAAWSVWPYTVLPAPLGWLGALGVASLALTPVNDTLGRWLHRLRITLSNQIQVRFLDGDRRRWFAIIAAAMAIPFWLFRIRHLRWGDSLFIVQALSYTGPDRPVWTIYNWQSPLTIFIHAQLWLLLNPITGVRVDTLYAITSVLSGVGFVYVLFLLADTLGRDRLEKATIFGLVITTGSMQLFFGYVENYTIISLGLILTLYLAVRCLRGEINLAWPSLVLAVTNGFHPSTIVLWPALGYAAWQLAERRMSAGSKASEWAKLALPPILVFAGLAALMTAGGHGLGTMLVDDRPGGADGIPFVPLFQVTTEWQHYTMFSFAHWLDWFNEHFLISPFGLPLLLLALATRTGWQKSTKPREGRTKPREGGTKPREGGTVPSQSEDRSQPGLRQAPGDSGITAFLVIAGLAYLLLTFVWNPDYGGRQDWDLFAPSAFVYTPLAAFLLIRQLGGWGESPGGRRTLARAARLLFAASALHTIAWVYYNTIPWPPGR